LLTVVLFTVHNNAMKLHSAIEDIMGSKVKIGILRLLYRTRSMYSGREISRLVGFSPTHTIANLRDLEASGLILRQRAGKTDLYRLNEKNSAINGVLKPIYDWESGLLGELAAMYVERLGDKVVSIRLFGSVARDDQKPGSDIDLVLTVADGVDLQEMGQVVTGIDLDAGQKLGCPVSTVVVTEKEYKKKLRSKQGFWKDVAQESKIIFELER
jgi:predicted nucleotidyltransferase/DNA-binding HxlR family transcriptional regulator